MKRASGCKTTTCPGRTVSRAFAAIAVAIAVLLQPSPAVAQTIVSSFGTPKLDGVLAPGEWANAGSVAFVANTPRGGTTPATLLVMNDATNIYLAVRFARTIVDPGNSVSFEFDKDASGSISAGDDAIVFSPGAAPPFFDDFRTAAPPCPPNALCAPRDVDFGGTNDGGGAFANDGTYSVYEVWHPLKSGDPLHDIQIAAGQTIGIQLSLRMIGPGGRWPEDFGDTDLPPGGFLLAVTTAAPVQPAVEVPTLGVPGLAALIALMGLACATARRRGS
jgi:hypothetical protein